MNLQLQFLWDPVIVTGVLIGSEAWLSLGDLRFEFGSLWKR